MSTPKLVRQGEVITDAVRAPAKKGDGRLNDSSFGIWEATTNLILNGGLETNTDWWGTTYNAVMQRTNKQAKFGSNSLRVSGAATYDGVATNVTLLGNTPYTISCWVYCPEPMTLQLEFANFVDTIISTKHFAIPAGVWTRISTTATTNAGTSWYFFLSSFNGAGAFTFYVDGIQVEQQPLATPYVETDGASASRAAARIEAPVSLIDEMQSWVAIRVRPAWATAGTVDPGGGASPPFSCAYEWVGGGDIMGIYAEHSANTWRLHSSVADAINIPQGHAASEEITLIGAWTATNHKISLNGAAFVANARTTIPVLTGMTFDIGSRQGTNHFDGEILWFACGTGILTDADAAYLHAFGNNDPKFDSKLNSMGVSAIMPFIDDSYRIPALHSKKSPRIVNATGPVKPGELLVLDMGEWDGYPTPEIGIKWERAKLANFNDVLEIPGEHESTYRVAPWDRGYYIRAKVGVA